MTVLDYHISPLSPERSNGAGLTSASEADLRYALFLGDVIFRIGDADFSARWDWVPILDFAIGLERAVEELQRGKEHSEYDFTESDAAIRFARDEGEVFVSATFVPYRAVVALSELLGAAHAFRTRVVDELCSTYPELRRNTVLQDLIR